MESRPPLTPRVVVATGIALGAADVGVWVAGGVPGLVLGAAAVVALLVTAAPSSRDAGVSLLVAVLLGAFVLLAMATFLPRLRG